MGETETETSPGGDARAAARQHTAQLLKMLRGYGPVGEPKPAAAAGPNTVAEAATGYARRLEAASYRSSPSPAVVVSAPSTPSSPPPSSIQRLHTSPSAAPPSPSSPPDQRPHDDPISSVGELLCRQPRELQQGPLGSLLAQTGQLIRHGQIFRAYLPPHLLDHAVLVRMDQDHWIVHTDSASWATRLRYALYNIRVALGQQLKIPLPKPHIRVIPPAQSSRPQWPRLTLTERNAQLLEVTARDMSDARLSAALRRLATRGGPLPDSPERDS